MAPPPDKLPNILSSGDQCRNAALQSAVFSASVVNDKHLKTKAEADSSWSGGLGCAEKVCVYTAYSPERSQVRGEGGGAAVSHPRSEPVAGVASCSLARTETG